MAILATKLRTSTSCDKGDEGCNCCLWFLASSCVILLVLLCASLYVLYTCNEYSGYFSGSENKMLDDDEIKLQLYLLESHYYLDELDKEEVKLSNIAKDYKMAKRYASKREPNCIKELTEKDSIEFEKVETLAASSMRRFKELLSNWNDNIDYMDIDRTVPSILNQYQDIYFKQGNWKEEKIEKNWNQLKEYYTNAINEMEECAVPNDSHKEDLQKIQNVRKRLVEIENELDEKLKLIDYLDKELITAVNSVLPVSVKCLYDFPKKWGYIQSEEMLAIREIQVLKFKLKQIRYKLMIADTSEKIDFLVKWEDDFTRDKKEKYRLTIDNHYETAKSLQERLLNQINKCSGPKD